MMIQQLLMMIVAMMMHDDDSDDDDDKEGDHQYDGLLMKHLRAHHKPLLTLVQLPDQRYCSGEPVVSYRSTTFNNSMYAQSACNTISHALDMEDSRFNI